MPEVGEKFKSSRLPGHTLSFYKEGTNPSGTIVWWEFFDVKDGKHRYFYPEEVYPEGQKRKRDTKAKSSASRIEIDPDAEPFEIVVDGETIRVV